MNVNTIHASKLNADKGPTIRQQQKTQNCKCKQKSVRQQKGQKEQKGKNLYFV